MFGRKNTFAIRAGLCTLAIAGMTSAALAVDFSLDRRIDDYTGTSTNRGTVDQTSPNSNPRRFLFRIQEPRIRSNGTKESSRAEIRRESRLSGTETMGGTFILNNQSGNYLSIIQALNVREAGSPTGSSEPVAQLAIRKTGGRRLVNGENRDIYEFYIEQASGKPTCTGLGTFVKGDRVQIRMEYREGRHPVFYRRSGGQNIGSCTGGKSDRKMGDPSGSESGTYFYGKLGVYHTHDGTGAASMTWDNVYD